MLAHYYRPQALETAIPLLEKIVVQDPKFAPAFADLGRANFLQFSQQRDTEVSSNRHAKPRCARLPSRPDLASAHVTLGFLYAFTDQNDLASQELDEALRLDKFNAAAYGALAELQTRQGRTELVEATLQKAVSLAPDDWLLNMQLGAHYLDRGKWAQAGEQFRHAVDLVPDNPRAYNNLGLVYRGLGKLDDAAAAFQKAIDLEPTFIHFRNLGMVLAEAGRYPGGRAGTRTIDRTAPESVSRLGDARIGLRQPARRRGEGEGDVSQGDRPRRRPAEADAEGRVSPRRCRRLLRRGREWRRKACRCSRRRRRSRRKSPKCSTRWRSGTRWCGHRDEALVGLLKREPAAILPRRLREIPCSSRSSRGPAIPIERRRESLTPSTKGEM